MAAAARRLAEIRLTGWRHAVRITVLALVAVCATFTAGAYAMAPNRIEQTVLAVVAMAALVTMTARGASRRFPRGIWIGLVALATTCGTCTATFGHVGVEHGILDHEVFGYLASHTHQIAAADRALSGLLLTFGAGLALIAVELFTHLAERARLRRDEDPAFPAARVLRR